MINVDFKTIREKVLCPTFWVMLGTLGLFIIAHAIWYNKYYSNNDFYQNNYSSNLIREEMLEKAVSCGNNSFFSWIIIDTKTKDRYRFVDVLGYNGVGVFSIKNSNNLYKNEHELSGATYDFLSKFPSGFAAYYDDLNNIKYKEVKNILANTNNILLEGGFSVAKKNNDIVYVFLYTRKEGYGYCSRQEIVDFLQQLSFKVEFGLR